MIDTKIKKAVLNLCFEAHKEQRHKSGKPAEKCAQAIGLLEVSV